MEHSFSSVIQYHFVLRILLTVDTLFVKLRSWCWKLIFQRIEFGLLEQKWSGKRWSVRPEDSEQAYYKSWPAKRLEYQ